MEIFSNGDCQDQIINLISRHNDGICQVTLEEIQTYLKMRSFVYIHGSNSLLQLSEDCEHGEIHEKGKTFMRITKEYVHELQNIEN